MMKRKTQIVRDGKGRFTKPTATAPKLPTFKIIGKSRKTAAERLKEISEEITKCTNIRDVEKLVAEDITVFLAYMDEESAVSQKVLQEMAKNFPDIFKAVIAKRMPEGYEVTAEGFTFPKIDRNAVKRLICYDVEKGKWKVEAKYPEDRMLILPCSKRPLGGIILFADSQKEAFHFASVLLGLGLA